MDEGHRPEWPTVEGRQRVEAILSAVGAMNDECIHDQPLAWCAICLKRESGPTGHGTAQTKLKGSDRVMHVLVKWNPKLESDTLERHRKVAQSQGSTWWGCDTIDDPRSACRVSWPEGTSFR